MTTVRAALAITIGVAAVVANGLVRPYFAVEAAEPTVVHASLGLHPVWAPPTTRDAHEALRCRFPERFSRDVVALRPGEFDRVYRVRLNVVRWAAQWLAALGVAAVCVWVACPRRRGPGAA